MPRTIEVAVVQMAVSQAALGERLDRAGRLITQAAQSGAQLVVLPELFNTGYAYSDANYRLAEPLGGTTSSWMKESAARLGIHLAGSLMLLEEGEIYNALLLFSPAGQMWRYDKNYPWAWERGYYRGRRGATVAHTELGDLGMMVCWDVGHPNLWREYAGKVDMMVMASCPPDGTNPTFHFPDGSQIGFDDLSFMESIKGHGKRVFGEMVNEQAAWLGVPAVNTGGAGSIQTSIPRGAMLVWGLSCIVPRLTKQWSQASRMKMSCDMITSCKVVDANGRVQAERTPAEGDAFARARVALPDSKSLPQRSQPKSPLNRGAYFGADVLIPFLMKRVYRKGLQGLRASTEG